MIYDVYLHKVNVMVYEVYACLMSYLKEGFNNKLDNFKKKSKIKWATLTNNDLSFIYIKRNFTILKIQF